MTNETPYLDHPILPGKGGLDTETDPTLIDASRSPELENIHFSKSSIEGALGSRKIHRELPRLAGVRFLPRPIVRVAAQTNPALCPYAVLPYVEEQQLAATDDMQWDLSFRLNGAYPYTLTGRDQTEDASASPPESGKIGAPSGGEFQFQPLLARGGSDIEELIWVIGLGVIRPEGYKSPSGTPDTAVDASQKDVIFPCFYWWNRTLRKLEFAAADTYMIPGYDYHLSLQIGQSGGSSAWYMNGVQLGEVPTGDGASLLPTMNQIDRSNKYALYICRPLGRDMGKWDDAPLFRGLYGVTVQNYTANPAAEDALQINSLQLPGVGPNSWENFYIRVNDPGNANDGEIRRITAFGGANTCSIGADMPNAVAMVGATVDVVPPMEACCQDVVVSELRLWKEKRTADQIQRLAGWRGASSLTSSEPWKNLFASIVGSDVEHLVGYWPMSEDGGTVLQDLTARNNSGWFGGSIKHRSALDGTISLDGDRVAIQKDIGETAERSPALGYNLGTDGYRIHVKQTYQLCRDIVDRAVWAITCLNVGTDGNTVTVQDGAGGSETFEIEYSVTAPGIVPGNVAVDVEAPSLSLNAEETASRLKTAIDGAIGGTLGAHLSTELSGHTVYVYSNDVDYPFPAVAFTETGATFAVREAVERGFYEVLYDHDDPEASSVEPVLSLRWTKVNGNRWFYFVWFSGLETYIVPVDRGAPSEVEPAIGQRVNAYFGIQRQPGTVDGHRFYYFLSDGVDSIRGWSETVFQATQLEVKNFSRADDGKRRISIGASVVGEESLGSGTHNACLMRLWEVWVGLRPFINLVGSPTLIRFPATDPWTTLDRVIAPADVMPVISADAATVALERASTAFSPTSGANFSTRLDSYPTKYLLILPGVPKLHLEEDRSQRTDSVIVAVEDMTLSVGTLASPWNRESLASVEARVASYIWGTDFEPANPFSRLQGILKEQGEDIPDSVPGPSYEPEEISLSSVAAEDETWALTELFQDRGAIAWGASEPEKWLVAILPSATGVPQELFQAFWSDGLVKGIERVRGLGQLELPDGTRDLVAGINGGLYLANDRWKRDHPQPTDEDRYSIYLENQRGIEAEKLEELLEERLRESWRNKPFYAEGVQLPDTGTVKVQLPYIGSPGTTYYTFFMTIKLSDTAGRRTLASRVGMRLRPPGRDLVELKNFWWYLDDGCPVFLIDNFDDYYEVKLGESDIDLIRDNIVLDRWVRVGVEIAINWTGNAFGTPAFFFDGRRFENTVVNGALLPNEIPTDDQLSPANDEWVLNVSSTWLGVYGNDDPNHDVDWDSPAMVPFRYGIGGGMSNFSHDRSDTPAIPHAPHDPI